MNTILVIGLGNRWRGDDAAGPLVLDGLRRQQLDAVELLESPGDSLSLVNAWADRDTVYLIDACYDDGLADGSILTIDNALDSSDALQSLRHPTSSHVLDVEQAIGLSRAMGNTPERLTVYAVSGSQFAPGSEPGTAVLSAVDSVVCRLVEILSLG